MNAPVGHSVQTRWQDLDALGHVGHKIVLTYLEEGRDRFLAERGIRREDYVVGRCSIRYLDEIAPGSRAVTVQCEIRKLGTSSLTTEERIVSDQGHVLVEAEFGLVLWDPQRRSSRPITDDERASLAAAAR